MQPFSITLFATTGDPEGIRHLDKSNWSGYGVVFNRELLTCTLNLNMLDRHITGHIYNLVSREGIFTLLYILSEP